MRWPIDRRVMATSVWTHRASKRRLAADDGYKFRLTRRQTTARHERANHSAKAVNINTKPIECVSVRFSLFVSRGERCKVEWTGWAVTHAKMCSAVVPELNWSHRQFSQTTGEEYAIVTVGLFVWSFVHLFVG